MFDFLLKCFFILTFCFAVSAQDLTRAQEKVASPAPESEDSLVGVLGKKQAKQLEQAVEKALGWLAKQQSPDGSFPTLPTGQPGVTSLSTMAFMASGHLPGEGDYGRRLEVALNYVLSTQQEDGLFCAIKPKKQLSWGQASHTATYNHAVTGLMLTECYGMIDSSKLPQLSSAIEKGIAYTLKLQRGPKPFAVEEGGWRYILPMNSDYQGEADVSVTGWHMMFLRSAKNAGFDVPEDRVKQGAKYIANCYSKEHQQFFYGSVKGDRRANRGMTGAGVLSLSMAGKHQTEVAQEAGTWLLKHPIAYYQQTIGRGDRFHYAAYYTSHAMYQMGGEYWRGYYPPLVKTFLSAQWANGAWPIGRGYSQSYGDVYSTAMSVLALTPPYDLLPIYQR